MIRKHLSALVIAALTLLALAGTAMAQSSAQVAYQHTPANVPANMPEIPSVAGATNDPRCVPGDPSTFPTQGPVPEECQTEVVPTVAGEQRTPPVAPTATDNPSSPSVAGVQSQLAGDPGTLPVTGLDALLILAAAAAAGGVGFALRRAAAAR